MAGNFKELIIINAFHFSKTKLPLISQISADKICTNQRNQREILL